MRQRATSKSEVISAIRTAKRRLKRAPTRSEFQSMSGIHWMKVQRLFGGYRAAVREAGLEPDPGGIRIDTAAMLMDFGRVAREVKRHPTREEYEKLGRYASASLETRFHHWSAVRQSFLEYVAGNGLEREWGDVAESLRNGPVPRRGGGKNWLRDRRDRPPSPSSRVIGKPTPLKHRGTEEAEKNWVGRGLSDVDECTSGSKEFFGSKTKFLPRIDADDRGSGANPTALKRRGTKETEEGWVGGPPERQDAIKEGTANLLPLINADERRSRPEPVRAEILYPQLRGMRRVTNTMLFVMCAYQSTTHEVMSEELAADEADSRGWESKRTDKSIYATPAQSGEAMRTERNACATQSQTDGIIRTGRSVCATQLWATSTEPALYFPKWIIPGRPLMGAPLLPLVSQSRSIGAGDHLLMLHGMAYEPVNEMGVVFLFGMVAPLLGFRVEALQPGFPDCKAKLEVEPGRWQDVNVEFEYESRKFREHHHDPEKCDIIVCWRHNWKGCPERIQVVELSSILGVR